jgi:hypothetical protein
MALYNVIKECVIEIDGVAKHFARPHPTPVEVDDAVAAPLVEAGSLTAVEASATSPEPVAPGPDEVAAEPEGEAPAGRPLLRRPADS